MSSLKDKCQFSEAAEILSDHLGDVEESIAVLVQGRLWNEAVWSSYHHKRADIIGRYMWRTWYVYKSPNNVKEMYSETKLQFLQEPHCITSQKIALFSIIFKFLNISIQLSPVLGNYDNSNGPFCILKILMLSLEFLQSTIPYDIVE